MESAVNPEILPDPAGQLAGRPLDEWNEAYEKVESYFNALRIRPGVVQTATPALA